jgi:hypothetical protein
MRARESRSALIEGRLPSSDARSELVKPATRLIPEEALVAETRDALGRDYDKRGAGEGRGYRNGHRTGHHGERGRDAGARAVGARHRGCGPRR